MTDHPENTQTPGLLKKSQVSYQTNRGPTVDSVAALLLRQALKVLQPEREIGPRPNHDRHASMAGPRRHARGHAHTVRVADPGAGPSSELNGAAVQLRAQGIGIRASLLKDRQPRQAYLQWLLDNDQVRIVRNEQGRIKTKKRRDYFQEYQVLDTTNKDQPLRLAHFHYDSLDAPMEQFTAAHLKIAEAHLQQFTTERRQVLTTLAPIDYVLRRISDPNLFLKLETQP
ncbi:hypothetical protein D3C78_461850 [compost metagenome]